MNTNQIKVAGAVKAFTVESVIALCLIVVVSVPAAASSTTFRVQSANGYLTVYKNSVNVGRVVQGSSVTIDTSVGSDSVSVIATADSGYILSYFTDCRAEPTAHYTMNPLTVTAADLAPEVCYYFRAMTVPGAPSGLSPSGTESDRARVDIKIRTVFSWYPPASGDAATSYKIWIIDEANNNYVKSGFDVGSVLSYTLDVDLVPGRNYKWSVAAGNSIGVSSLATYSYFTMNTWNTAFPALTIKNYDKGIYIANSTSINITDCSLLANGDGISMAATTYTNIRNNNIVGSGRVGVALSASSNNTIEKNNIYKNTTANASDSGASNTWKNNYYGDYPAYTGSDLNIDGFGDTAYTFAGGFDVQPLMDPVEPPKTKEIILQVAP